MIKLSEEEKLLIISCIEMSLRESMYMCRGKLDDMNSEEIYEMCKKLLIKLGLPKEEADDIIKYS